jgi:hypothetical protein
LGVGDRATIPSAAALASPSISISDTSVIEGDSGRTLATFRVTLSEPSRLPVWVGYVTANGTARAGADYSSRLWILSFPARTTSATISVPILDDSDLEDNETFAVLLFGPVRAVIADGIGIGTIIDDDDTNAPPTIGSLSSNPDPVTVGRNVTLTANDVNDPDGSIRSVSFYRETNSNPGLQTGTGGDALVDTDSSSTGGWSTTFTTTGLAAGTYTYYAQARDDDDALSNIVSTTSRVQAPLPRIAFDVIFGDDLGEGFFDATLGPARQDALRFALDRWSSLLVAAFEGETITIFATMDSLGPGDGTRVPLAGAAPLGFFGPGPISGSPTVFGAPLANHLFEGDLNPALPEINMIFNSDVDDDTVLGTRDWYYGTDANPGGDIDFVTVALHEVGHGLNFFDLIDPASGNFFFGIPGVYDRFLEDEAGTRLTRMSPRQRSEALISGDLYWGGPGGIAGNGGSRPRLYAPDPFRPGSSVSHLDETTHTNELMSPFYSGPDHVPGPIELGMLSDMGWTIAGSATAPGSIASSLERATEAASSLGRLDMPLAMQGGREIAFRSSDPYGRSVTSRQARGFEDPSLYELALNIIDARTQGEAAESMFTIGQKSRKAAQLRTAFA